MAQINETKMHIKDSINLFSKPKVFTVTSLNFIKNLYKPNEQKVSQNKYAKENNNTGFKSNISLKSFPNFSIKNILNKKLTLTNSQNYKTEKNVNFVNFINTNSKTFNKTSDTYKSNMTVETNSDISKESKNDYLAISPFPRPNKNPYNFNFNISSLRGTISNTNKPSTVSSTSRLFKNEVNLNMSLLAEEETKQVLQADTNQVIKLNFWEKENILSDNESKIKIDFRSTNVNLKEIESLNYSNDIRKSIGKLNLKNVSKQIQEFYNKDKIEQSSILLQNINFEKKKFNFEVFSKNRSITQTNKTNDCKFQTERNKNSSSIQDEAIFKFDNFNVTGDIESLSKIENYRQIIREKIKLENSFFKELNKTHKQIIENKIEKKKLETACRDITNYISFLMKGNRSERIKTYNSKDTELSSKFSKNLKIPINIKMNFFKDQKEKENRIINNENHIRKLTLIYEEKSKILLKINNEWLHLKSVLFNLTNDQKKYYFDILKIGIDVRTYGLTWVVKKLIELNSQFESSMFPRFLDKFQIDYLLKYSYKSMECLQLKLILKILKNKAKDKTENSEMRSTKSSIKLFDTFSPKIGIGLLSSARDSNNTISDKRKLNSTFSNNVKSIFDNISKHHNTNIKFAYEQQVEDASVEIIVDNLKKKIKMLDHDENILDKIRQETTNLIKVLEDNKQNKECYDQIFQIKNKIQEIEKEIVEMREEGMKVYRRKYDVVNMINSNKRVTCDLIYTALFGNGIGL